MNVGELVAKLQEHEDDELVVVIVDGETKDILDVGDAGIIYITVED